MANRQKRKRIVAAINKPRPLISLLPLTMAAVFTASNAGAKGESENESIVRAATGVHECKIVSENRVCGYEEFKLTVQPDGSRTVRIFNNRIRAKAQHNVILRVDENFRPIEAVSSPYRDRVFRTGLFTVEGNTLNITVNEKGELKEDSLQVPDHFSLGTHPVTGDGWHFAYYDKEKGGEQKATIYWTSTQEDSLLGRLREQRINHVGKETVTVPAGTFETDHFTLDDEAHMWITGPDDILVKFVWEPFDMTYTLIEYDDDL